MINMKKWSSGRASSKDCSTLSRESPIRGNPGSFESEVVRVDCHTCWVYSSGVERPPHVPQLHMTRVISSPSCPASLTSFSSNVAKTACSSKKPSIRSPGASSGTTSDDWTRPMCEWSNSPGLSATAGMRSPFSVRCAKIFS